MEQPLLQQEITVEEAVKAGFIGLRLGDSFVQHAGTWMAKTWTVSVDFARRELSFTETFSTTTTRGSRLRNSSLGVSRCPRTLLPLDDLQPLIASVHDRQQRVEEVLTLYREHAPPLEMVATLARVSVPDLMRDLQGSEDFPPLLVGWSDDEGLSSSQSAVREAEAVVLTRSAMFSLRQMRLYEAVAKSRRLIAPRALRTQVREELELAREVGGRGTEDNWKGRDWANCPHHTGWGPSSGASA